MQGDRRTAGFSFVEALVALLIVVMVSVIVATGVPSAINAYYSAVASSNAQVALSTLTTVLRDELGAATEVKLAENGNEVEVYWNSSSGNGECAIANGTGSSRGPVKTVKTAVGGDGSPVSWTLIPDAQLTTAQGQLKATFDSITYSDHVFKVSDLKISDDKGKVLARIGEGDDGYLAIRAPLCTVQP